MKGNVIGINDSDSNIKQTALYPDNGDRESAFNPYGTLVWYFNSKRELAYISNQIINLRSKIKENSVKANLFKLGTLENPRGFGRQIRSVEELTGRLTQDEIEKVKSLLERPWSQTMQSENDNFRGIDILLATNMISVGVDIQRLGLMVVNGQPRTTAEYIQATSRVGRQHPGLVVSLYNHSKSKDRSHYETFKNYHQSFYQFVEQVSVTPFSSGARKRALAAIFVSLVRGLGQNTATIREDSPLLDQAKNWILDAVREVDPDEYVSTEKDIYLIIKKWTKGNLSDWGKMGGNNRQTGVVLLDQYGDELDNVLFEAPTSLRSSDLNSQAILFDG